MLFASEPTPCTLKLKSPIVFPVLIKKEVPAVEGMRLAGLGVQGLGGEVEPAVQLSPTRLL